MDNINELISSLNEVYNEELKSIKSFNEGLLKKYNDHLRKKEEEEKLKNKAKEKGLTPEQYRKLANYKLDSEDKKYEKEMWNKCEKAIKKIISQIKSSQEFKDICKKGVENYNNNFIDEWDKPLRNNYIPKLNCEDIGGGFVIIDEDQYIRIAFSKILDLIIKKLKSDYQDIKFKYSTGDGDEGCIYPDIWTSDFENRIIKRIKNGEI